MAKKIFRDQEMVCEYGKLISILRKYYGLTLYELAEDAQVSYSTVRNLELGKSDVSFTEMIRILKALGYTIRIEPKD